MDHYNPNASMLPNAGGNIMAMRGGGVPAGYNPDASVIPLPPTANSIPIVDMKGGDETLPMSAAATTVSAPLTPSAPSVVEAKPPGKPIRFILFGKEFNSFSTTPTVSSQSVLALLGEIKPEEKQTALQNIYDGIINLRKSDVLTTYPHFKRLLTRMGLNYAKDQNELKEEITNVDQTEIKLAFPNDKEVTVTLTIPCDQIPSCRQKKLSMAAAATAMLQKGGDDSRTIQLFGVDYLFPKRPTDINHHLDLLKELEVEDKDASFKLTLLEEIYDGCYTDGSIISKIKCSTFGELLEELGQKYAIKMQKQMGLVARPKKAIGLTKRKDLPNGDIELTFSFSNFGKQIDIETQKKINATLQKSASAQSTLSKIKHTFQTVSSDQVSIHGMINQNNACFCISTIQLLFSIPQIRTTIKKHGCDSELLAQILTQIHNPEDEITTVNKDGIMCALFNLFEELGENMALFSTLMKPEDLKAGEAIPYELLGYIMKNFEIDRTKAASTYHVGRQEDAELFLTFLFGIFDATTISPLFQFTQKTTIDPVQNVVNQPSSSAEEKESHQTVWKIPNENKHEFKTSYEGKREQRLTKQSTATEENIEVTYHTTLELEKNPYLLVRPSDPSGDLSGIPLEFSIQKGTDSKQFKLYGIIRKSGDPTGGHYVYDRQDLASTKHIVYNDTSVTLVNEAIQMTQSNGLNAYLLIYAEMGQEDKEKHFEEEVRKMEETIRTTDSTLIETIRSDIEGDNDKVEGAIQQFINKARQQSQAGGSSLLLFDSDQPMLGLPRGPTFKEFPNKLASYAQHVRNPTIPKPDMDPMKVMSHEMDEAKDIYLTSADNNEKRKALVAYAIFSILTKLVEEIKPMPKNKAATMPRVANEPAAQEIQEPTEENRQKQLEINEQRQRKNKIGATGPTTELTSLPTSPLSSKAKAIAEQKATNEKKAQAASLLVSMRTLSDEIQQLKQNPEQNSDEIREKIFELTAMRSNVNEIQGINKSDSAKAATILSEAMKAKQVMSTPTLPKPVNAANAERRKQMKPVVNELKAKQEAASSPSSSRSVSPSANIARSTSLVNKMRATSAKKAENAKVTKAEREERQKLYQAERNAIQAKQNAVKRAAKSERAAEQAEQVDEQEEQVKINNNYTSRIQQAQKNVDKQEEQSQRLQILNKAEQDTVSKKAMDDVNKNKQQIAEYRQTLQELKSTVPTGQQNVNNETIKELHQTEMALMKEYINQMKILKDAIKEIGAKPASADLSAEVDVILGRLQDIYSYDRDLKRDKYTKIAKAELELYKEGEVLRDKARYHMGLEKQKPAESSSKEAVRRARAMSPYLYQGGRRTLRAAKKKRTLRAANKKRTLRASKKLRRSTPSK